MYFILRKETIRNILSNAAKKAGGMKALSIELKIAKSTLYLYYNNQRALSQSKLSKILKFSEMKLNESQIVKRLPNNWRQIKGGKRGVETKKQNGTFERQLSKSRERAREISKKWHKMMKKERTREYYLSQYEKFKKIGEYKFTTKKGEKVRNQLEKDVADILFKLNIKYEYEPYVNAKNKAFFPDFLINKNIVVECTAWRGYDKAVKLKDKINCFRGKYMVYVVIPKALYNYYKIINNHLVLGLDEFVPLAQTFPRL